MVTLIKGLFITMFQQLKSIFFSDVDSQKIVLFFETMLYYGNDCISPSYFTEEIRISKELDWSEWIRFPISFKDLPRVN